MEAIGFMSSSKSVATRNSGLSRQFSEFLKLSKSSSIRGLHCKKRRQQPGPVQAVLLERAFPVEDSHAAKLKEANYDALERSVRPESIPLHELRQGGFAEENALLYRQLFVIRSYEVGADKSTSIKEIFSLFQEMALNHVHLLGIAGDGFGATRAMNRLGLIWVVTKMQVDVDRYPAW
jgi:hypothetical protein